MKKRKARRKGYKAELRARKKKEQQPERFTKKMARPKDKPLHNVFKATSPDKEGTAPQTIEEQLKSTNMKYEHVVAAMCKKSFFKFVEVFWDVIIQEDPVWNWHIKEICDELQAITPGIVAREPKKYDLLINVPPGTTKSTIVTIMWPAWLWAMDPSLRIINNSYSGDIATEHAVKSRDIIFSKLYKKCFPHVRIRKDKSGKRSYDNTETGARYTTSTGASITGKHSHVIINDDPQNPMQAASEAHRREAINHTKTLSSRKVDKEAAVTVTVMQRLDTQDVSGYLLENKREELRHISLPAKISASIRPIPEKLSEHYRNGLLDPKRLSERAIAEAKVDLGSRAYTGQWLQQPTVEGGDIIQRDWFRYIGFNEFIQKKAEAEKEDPSFAMHFFGDTAYTEKTQNDPSGFISACRIGNHIYILSGKKVHKTLPDMLKWIPRYVTANQYTSNSTIRIEPKASGTSIIQAIDDWDNFNVVATKAPTDSKLTRLHSKSATIEAGRVILVEGSWNEEFVDEVTGFPNMPHDEYVDLVVYAIDYLLDSDDEVYETKETLSEMGIIY